MLLTPARFLRTKRANRNDKKCRLTPARSFDFRCASLRMTNQSSVCLGDNGLITNQLYFVHETWITTGSNLSGWYCDFLGLHKQQDGEFYSIGEEIQAGAF